MQIISTYIYLPTATGQPNQPAEVLINCAAAVVVVANEFQLIMYSRRYIVYGTFTYLPVACSYLSKKNGRLRSMQLKFSRVSLCLC